MREIVTLTKSTFPKSIQIIADIPAELGLIEMDATQLHQVLLNLCVNARDAVGEGGTITLRGARTELRSALATVRGELAPGKGTGLGLATVAMIVEKQRGGIVLRTAPGEGTTFSIYLTAAQVTSSERMPVSPKSLTLDEVARSCGDWRSDSRNSG